MILASPESEGLFLVGESDAELIERYNEAIGHLRADRVDVAIPMLEAIVEATGDSKMREQARSAVEMAKRFRRHKAQVDGYNEAIALARNGERGKAVEILRELATEVEDASLAEQVRSVLRELGASP